jgi:hypothetical protein
MCTNPNFPQCDCNLHANPIYTYDHRSGGGAAIIGGTVVRNPNWPDVYNGAYFFADFSRGTMSYGKHNAGTGAFEPVQFHTNIPSIISVTQDSTGDIWMTA